MFRGKHCVARAAMAVLIAGCVLSSCSSASSVPSASTNRVPQELLDSLNSHCTDLRSPTLGEGTLCVDSGFRMKVDDFSFANYGRDQSADANVTVQTMIDLFGHSAVCMPGDETQCVLRPTTIQKLEEWNNALSGGRCEGFAALSTRFQLGIENPVQYGSGATRVVDLKKDDGRLQSAIVYWWSTQFLREVADRAATSRQESPLALVDDLIQGIANRVGYTLAIYSSSQGHSVTPFAVTRRGASFIIHVYDNNYPGVRKEISVDTRTNTWTYGDAAPGADGGTTTWSGGTGTIELTPMSARQGPFECTFCNVATIPAGAPNVISLASRDVASPGYLRITVRSGAVLDITPEGVTNSIPGAVVTASKGSSAGLSSVSIPGDLGDLDIEVRRASSDIPAGDVVLTVQRPAAPTVQVSGNLATLVAGTPGSGNPIVTLRSGEATVTPPPGQRARVTLAAGSNLSRATLEPGQALSVSPVRNDAIAIAVRGSNGSTLGSTSISASGSIDSNVVTITADPGTASLSTSTASITPVPVEKRSTTGPSAVTTTSTPATSTTAAPPRPPSTSSTVPTIEITLPSRSTGAVTPTTSANGCRGKSCRGNGNNGNSDNGKGDG